MESEDKVIKMTVAVLSSLRKELKIQAAKEGRNLSDVVTDALTGYLKQHNQDK